jgi:hypothetical protein
MPDNIRKMVIDGITIPVTEEGETFIKKLQADIARLTTDNIKLVADHNTALAAKDATIAEKDKAARRRRTARSSSSRTQALTPAALDKLVSDRSTAVLGKAKLVADADYSGKTPQPRSGACSGREEAAGDAASEGQVRRLRGGPVRSASHAASRDRWLGRCPGHERRSTRRGAPRRRRAQPTPGGRQVRRGRGARRACGTGSQDAWKKAPETAGHVRSWLRMEPTRPSEPPTTGHLGLRSSDPMPVQTTYGTNIAPAYEGMIANSEDITVVSKQVQTAAGVGYGKPAFQGTQDDQVKAVNDGSAIFRGITVGTHFGSARSRRPLCKQLRDLPCHGPGRPVGAGVGVAVAVGDPVYFDASDRRLDQRRRRARHARCQRATWDSSTTRRRASPSSASSKFIAIG